uniref:Helicase n=1 Tax=Kammavanpettai virus TaxID=2282480 RepID=A0A3G1RP45_9REOV|nr:helicase [Kammavanpettai virus]
MRIIMLAPSDLLQSCKVGLQNRDIDIKLEPSKENGLSQGSETEGQHDATVSKKTGDVGDSGDGEDSSKNRRTDSDKEGDHRNVEGEGKISGHGGEGTRGGGGLAGDGSGSTRRERPSDRKCKSGDKVPSLVNTAADDQTIKAGADSKEHLGSDRADNHSSEAASHLVLTERVKHAIHEHSGITVNLATEDSPAERILMLSSSVAKYIGLTADDFREQTDNLNALKKKAKSANLKSKFSKVSKIESTKALDSLFPRITSNANGKSSSTSVVLATNQRAYVDRAHVVFTVPTGDPTWKETMRMATRRSNVRAYSYDPDRESKSKEEAFLALVDSL